MTVEERLAAVERGLSAIEQKLEELRGGRALPKLAKAIEELEEAATVTAYQQAQLARQAKAHAEWLASHTKAIGEIRDLQRATDQRIDKLVSAIGEMLGGPK